MGSSLQITWDVDQDCKKQNLENPDHQNLLHLKSERKSIWLKDLRTTLKYLQDKYNLSSIFTPI